MTDSHFATLFSRNPAVIETEIEGEIVLLNPGDWDYFEFNSTATALWRLLDRPRALTAIVEELVKEFEIDSARCASETAPLLREMVTKGLVVTE